MENEEGGGSANEAQAPDLSALLSKVSEIIDSKLGPVQSIVNESKNKAQRRNEELASQLKAEREKREALEGKLKQAGLADGGSVDEGLQQLNAHFERLRADYDEQSKALTELQTAHAQAESKLRRKTLVDLVLGDVTPDAREDGLLMMDGYLKNKGIELDATQDLDALAQQMRERFLPRLSVHSHEDRGPQASRQQPGAPVDPSKVNWSQFKRWEDIPHNIRHLVPQEVFNRLATPGGGPGGFGGGVI